MELHLDLLRELNSKCLSLARVRKASRPSIRSQAIRGSGSVMGGSELAVGPAMRRMTKKTCQFKARKIFNQPLTRSDLVCLCGKIKLGDNVSFFPLQISESVFCFVFQ